MPSIIGSPITESLVGSRTPIVSCPSLGVGSGSVVVVGGDEVVGVTWSPSPLQAATAIADDTTMTERRRT
jgi:hypothetical protein